MASTLLLSYKGLLTWAIYLCKLRHRLGHVRPEANFALFILRIEATAPDSVSLNSHLDRSPLCLSESDVRSTS